MKFKSLIFGIVITSFFMLICPISVAQEINVETHNIDITKDTNQIFISENLKIKGDTDGYYETIIFWIQTDNTNEITVKYNGEEFKADDVLINTFFTINLLSKKSTTIAVSSDNTVYLAISIILIFFILLVLFSSRKKSKTSTPSKKTELKTSSEELLSTNKTLLMELLKDIEKKHRSKEISDDTYHKLKDRYKQEALEAMKQLEDMKLKVR